MSAVAKELVMEDVVQSALRFIEKSQVGAPDGVYVNGEWKAQVYTTPIAAAVGVGNLFSFHGEEEPSAFTTSSIINQLAVIYGDRPDLVRIPTMIKRALPSTERFREGFAYNFYPPRIWNGVRVHQAASMTLLPIWKGFTNVPQDADSTSVTYAARYYHGAMTGTDTRLPRETLNAFTKFRDLGRKAHYYNRGLGVRDSGAFLTWLFDENDPDMPHYYFADPARGSRIPFNRNDVDCIVNLNVLRTLALTKNSSSRGRSESCAVLSEVIEKKTYATCGIYYPNTYNFGYSMAMADRAGEKCLRPLSNRVVTYTLRHQDIDGGWYNNDNAEVNDRVQSTAFALYALAQFGDAADPEINLALRKGASFLFGSMSVSRDGEFYWKGETFFTATAIARSLVDWRSDVFTTSVALGALVRANEVLKNHPSDVEYETGH